MEYFSLKNDWDEINAARTNRVKKVVIGIALVGLLILVRVAGFLTLEYHDLIIKSENSSTRETFSLTPDQSRGTQNTMTGRATGTEDGSYWNAGINLHLPDIFRRDLIADRNKDELESVIRERLSKEGLGFLKVRVNKIEVSGSYRVPLLKSGQGKFDVSVDNGAAVQKYSGNFSGKLDFEARGICSVGNLKKRLADKISDIIVRTVKEDFEKK